MVAEGGGASGAGRVGLNFWGWIFGAVVDVSERLEFLFWGILFLDNEARGFDFWIKFKTVRRLSVEEDIPQTLNFPIIPYPSISSVFSHPPFSFTFLLFFIPPKNLGLYPWFHRECW